MIGRRIPLSCLIAGVLVAGCCPDRFTRPAGPDPSPAQLIERARERSAAVESFEYLTRMSYYGEGGARKGRVEILAARPDRFRFEALTPSDDTVAILISDGEQFISHERGQTVCNVGSACAANVSRLLPLKFEGPDLYELLVGGTPIPLHDRAEVRWDDCEGLWLLVFERDASGVRQEVWLRPDTHGVMKLRVSQGGDQRFTITFDDFQETDGVLLPRTLRLESPVRDTDLEIEIREAYLNQVDTSRPFEPVCPPGTTQRELPCR